MLRKLIPTLIGYLLGNELQPVSPQNRLPTEPKPANADTLLLQTTTVDVTAKDLLGNTATDIATIGSAGQYRTLIWTGVKTGATDISYTVLARTTNADGQPLGTGWLQVATGTITGAANSWFRIAITQTDGLYYDQYRIVVSQASGSQTLHSKMVGVRG